MRSSETRQKKRIAPSISARKGTRINCGKARVVRSIFSFRSFRIPTVGGIWYKDGNFSPLDLEKYHESGFVPYGNGSSTGSAIERKEQMATNNPYQALVEGFARLLSQGEALSPGGAYPT
jgi:hypothetical protein